MLDEGSWARLCKAYMERYHAGFSPDACAHYVDIDTDTGFRIVGDQSEVEELRELVKELEADLEESELKVIELHHKPAVPKAVIDALCQTERLVGYIAQCEAQGVGVGDSLTHAKAMATELRKSAGWH